jgi:hypothetical protein
LKPEDRICLAQINKHFFSQNVIPFLRKYHSAPKVVIEKIQNDELSTHEIVQSVSGTLVRFEKLPRELIQKVSVYLEPEQRSQFIASNKDLFYKTFYQNGISYLKKQRYLDTRLLSEESQKGRPSVREIMSTFVALSTLDLLQLVCKHHDDYSRKLWCNSLPPVDQYLHYIFIEAPPKKADYRLKKMYSNEKMKKSLAKALLAYQRDNLKVAEEIGTFFEKNKTVLKKLGLNSDGSERDTNGCLIQ